MSTRRQAAQLAAYFIKPCHPLGRHGRTVLIHARRFLQIQATPSSANPSTDSLDPTTSFTSSLSPPPADSSSPDARFEVLGSPASLLSVTLSASQNLYTRRGTLVGVSGTPENAVSSLSPLSPLRRAVLGVPFLYQKIASSTPMNLLIATKAPHTSFSVLHLDGRLDWIVAQRNGLVAWTGHTLSVKPSINMKMSLTHWGNTILTGRGLVALAGSGQIYQISLKAGESYIAHPSSILAYTRNTTPPSPYRFKSSTLRLQLPSLTSIFPSIQFFRTMQTTTTWRTLANIVFTVRTWARRTLWGDRLFLSFKGPATILLQSRGSRIRDVLTSRDVDEIAEAPAGLIYGSSGTGESTGLGKTTKVDDVKVPPKTSMSYATVDKSGRVAFEGKA